MHDTYKDILTLFKGRCGHQWVGSMTGYFACPICGDCEGDHHLVSTDPIALQIEDLGGAWEPIARAARKRKKTIETIARWGKYP
jgi:hypothetical protein